MKRYLFIVFILLIQFDLSAQDKTKFDIAELKTQNGLAKISDAGYSRVSNEYLDLTLIPGGYYTIGTIKGLSDKKLDDNCQITFGHPYAKTSYALFGIDGNWYKLDDYFAGQEAKPVVNNNEMKIISSKNGLFEHEFVIQIQQDGKSVKLIQKIKNLDNKSHSFGLGLVFDPALGQWGDGYVQLPKGFIGQDTSFSWQEGLLGLPIWEKASGAKGIGIELMFKGSVNIIAANWQDLYLNPKPEFSSLDLRKIYDLDLKLYPEEEQLSPGEEKTFEVTCNLIEPDFSSKVFARWDLPTSLTVDNGIMFPRSMESYIQLQNTLSTNWQGSISLESSDYLVPVVKEYNVSMNSNPLYQKIKLSSNILYEDKVVEVKSIIKENNQVIDEISRNVFIPATPVSETGLNVIIDSLVTSAFPRVELKFHVLDEKSGAIITHLANENVFLYENSNKISDFNFLQDTTGGVKAVDIVFALDVTGSMGNEIDEVKNHIIEFADSLKYQGVDYRLGMVTFLDAIENIYPFTTDALVFRNWVAQQNAHGGDDSPENSLEALKTAAGFDYRTNAKRIIIWITDAEYHENDWATLLTRQEVINMLLAKDITTNAIGTIDYKTSYYDPIVNATAGNYYNINGNFRDILLDISKFRTSGKYLISYLSPNINSASNEIKLEIRYAGIGGKAIKNYGTNGSAQQSNETFQFYPNPFNPSITFLVNSNNCAKGSLQIFNILGQRIKTISFNDDKIQKVVWDAKNDFGGEVSAGFYIVQVMLTDHNNYTKIETAKILYLK